VPDQKGNNVVTNHNERDYREYSHRSLVESVRRLARINWQLMHEYRKTAAEQYRRADTISLEMARSYDSQAHHFESTLRSALEMLNEALGRSGSLSEVRMRKWRAEYDARMENVQLIEKIRPATESN
jgi:hypothetical protein